eukprot:scaffold8421_cov114-Isochrysis_galbana.AAC.5
MADGAGPDDARLAGKEPASVRASGAEGSATPDDLAALPVACEIAGPTHPAWACTTTSASAALPARTFAANCLRATLLNKRRLIPHECDKLGRS